MIWINKLAWHLFCLSSFHSSWEDYARFIINQCDVLGRLLVQASSVREFELACVLNPNLFIANTVIEREVCACILYLIQISFIKLGQLLNDQLDCEGWAEEFRVPLLAVPQVELAGELTISLRCLNLVVSARRPESFS